MTGLDWVVVVLYVGFVLGIGVVLSRRQRSRRDYYVAGKRMAPWQVALSLVATQVSAISIIGAPAFIALKEGGGLKWWQYELAVPLSMILLMLTLVPLYHRMGAITIYHYLEGRYGRGVRTTISAIFLISRSLSSGVILFATGVVLSALIRWPLSETLLVVATITIVYTALGGIEADIYSDILQLAVLWLSAAIMVVLLLKMMDFNFLPYLKESHDRMQVFVFRGTGLGDGEGFSLWPMLFGGFFLYLSYYGTDQSEAQRLLTTKDARDAQKALMYNGLLRFPLVLTYSAVGILLVAFMKHNPDFLGAVLDKRPDFLVPEFVFRYFPPGAVGLFMAGIFAATMSSIDSAMNALSAATYEDFLTRLFPRLNALPQSRQVMLSKLLTVLWGTLSTLFALTLIRSPETVIELVNRIGSAFYGPILAVFFMGMFSRRVSGLSSVLGLLSGVAFNLYLWKFAPGVSWMWWNLFGFLVSCTVGYALSFIFPEVREVGDYVMGWREVVSEAARRKGYVLALLGAFVFIVVVSAVAEVRLGG